jgi:hypothetical protein
MDMVALLQKHADLVNIVINFSMLLVWLLYAHLLFNNYRRQRRPRLLINQGAGQRMRTRCLICNMSEEAIFVEFVLAVLRTDRGERLLPVTDEQTDEGGEEVAYSERGTRQGPIRSGDCRDVGSFEELYRCASHTSLEGVDDEQPTPLGRDERPYELEVQVVSIYGSEDLPVGAKRTFKILDYEDHLDVRPASVDTQSYLSRRDRRRMQALLQRFL